MKKPLILVTALGLMAIGAHASADHHRGPAALGPGAAHLAAAHASPSQGAEGYVLRHDPTGAPMCFDAAGAKAPLTACDGSGGGDNASTEHLLAFDPTGAPMCFDEAGAKAPLGACGPALEALNVASFKHLAAR